MGATGWKYFVPYQADLEAALQQLREKVFAEGQYLSGVGITRPDMEAALKACGADTESVLQGFAAQASDPELPAETRNKFATLVQQLRQLDESGAALPKPNSIEELLERQGASGTHSILDIVRISTTPDFGTVGPLSLPKLIEVFGTERPSHAQIQSKYEEGALEEYFTERWQGIYVIV